MFCIDGTRFGGSISISILRRRTPDDHKWKPLMTLFSGSFNHKIAYLNYYK